MCKSLWVVLAVLIVPAFAQADTTYVANSGSNSVSVITNDSGTNTVSVINTSTNAVTTVTVGKNPFDLAITGSGAKAYVTNAGSNSVSVINTASNTGTPNLALSPGTQTGDNSYGYNFGPVSGSGSGTQTFTVSNTGTGWTQVLALVVTASSSSGGSFTISNDTCTGGQAAPNWTCTFLVNAALSCLESGVIAAIGEMSVTGQSTGVHYIDLTLAVECQ